MPKSAWFGFLDGSIPAPPQFDVDSDKPSPAYSVWQKQDMAIMSVFISFLSEGIITHVLDATASHQI